jgi:hypothetical protein
LSPYALYGVYMGGLSNVKSVDVSADSAVRRNVRQCVRQIVHRTVSRAHRRTVGLSARVNATLVYFESFLLVLFRSYFLSVGPTVSLIICEMFNVDRSLATHVSVTVRLILLINK